MYKPPLRHAPCPVLPWASAILDVNLSSRCRRDARRVREGPHEFQDLCPPGRSLHRAMERGSPTTIFPASFSFAASTILRSSRSRSRSSTTSSGEQDDAQRVGQSEPGTCVPQVYARQRIYPPKAPERRREQLERPPEVGPDPRRRLVPVERCRRLRLRRPWRNS